MALKDFIMALKDFPEPLKDLKGFLEPLKDFHVVHFVTYVMGRPPIHKVRTLKG
jgi:hypothetical protein